MNPRRLIPAALAVALAILATAACQPVPPPPPKAAPVPERVAVAGDSITFQALYYGAAGTPAAAWDSQQKVGLGWRAEHAQPRVTADVTGTTTSPDVLVAAFGQNYRWTGFGPAQQNSVTAFSFTPHPATCLVLVLPYAAPSFSPELRAIIDAYRAHAQALAATRANTVLADWGEVAAAHPEYLDTDGIHLNTPNTDPAQDLLAGADGVINQTDPTAARAFLAMAQQGVDSCPDTPE